MVLIPPRSFFPTPAGHVLLALFLSAQYQTVWKYSYAMSLDQISHLPPEKQETILNGPALAPPPGVVPNFDHPWNRTTTFYAGISVCLLLVSLAIFVRGWFKCVCLKKLNMEDRVFYPIHFHLYIVLLTNSSPSSCGLRMVLGL